MLLARGADPDGAGGKVPIRCLKITKNSLLCFDRFSERLVEALIVEAAKNRAMRGHTECIELLLDNGAQVDKPSGVRFEDGTTLDAHANPWTVDELVALANANLAEDPANEVSINVYYVDGTFERDGVLGAAFTDRDLVIFRETLESNCDGGVLGGDSCDIGEESILRHEFGHLLGLVNRGLPQVEDHEDPDHPGHEVQEGCLMYFALETASGLFGGLLGGGEPVDFCAASKADIEALRTR